MAIQKEIASGGWGAGRVMLVISELAVSRPWMHRCKLTLHSTVGEAGVPGLFGLASGIRVWDAWNLTEYYCTTRNSI